MKSPVKDVFTTRLLNVYTDLLIRDALRRKGDFSKAVGVVHNQFNNISVGTANLPIDNQAVAQSNLYAQWGVNPGYLRGTETKMYLREPQPIERTKKATQKSMSGADVTRLLDELKELRERIAVLEAENESFRAKNPDKNQDKN